MIRTRTGGAWLAVENAVLAAVLLAAAGPVRAQVTVAPIIRQLVASPGETARYRLGIANNVDRPLSCEVRMENMSVDERGRPRAAPADAPRGCARWLQVDPQRFRLAPKTSKDVQVTVRVPRGAGGGYYASIYCLANEEGPASGRARGAYITMRVQVGSALLLLVQSRQPAPKVSVEGVGLGIPTTKGLRAGGWQASVRAVNKGTFHVQVEGRVEIIDGRGFRVAAAPLQVVGGYLLPDCPRRFLAAGPERLGDGEYAVVAHIGLAGSTGHRPFSQSFQVVKGTVSAGTQTAEIKAYLESIRPIMRLERAGEYLRLRPGARRSLPVRFRNLTTQALNVVAYLYDWDMNVDGEVRILPTGKLPRSASGFVTVQGVASASARGMGALKATAQLPSTSSGEYRVALVLNPVGVPPPTDLYSLRERAYLVTLRTEGTGAPEVKIRSVKVRSPGTPDGSFQVTLGNSGNLSCPVSGSVLVRDARGKTVEEGLNFGGEQHIVLPDCELQFTISWPRALPTGKYVALVRAGPVGSTEVPSTELAFQVSERQQ